MIDFFYWHYNPSVSAAFDSIEHPVYLKPCVFATFCVPNFLYMLINHQTVYKTASFSLFLQSTSSLNYVTLSLDSIIRRRATLSDEDFLEWFRGLVDGEGCFIITPNKNDKNFTFRFSICMHADNKNMLEYVAQRLKIGKIYLDDHFVYFNVSKQSEVKIIINIFDQYPLNTSKNLNFLMWKQGYELYVSRKTSARDLNEIFNQILNLKNQMNKKRTSFKQPEGHCINITSYWFLGFVEGEGFFSIDLKSNRLVFGVGQTASEVDVLMAVKRFLLDLPGDYKISRVDTNVVGLTVNKKAKNENSKPMARIGIYKSDFIKNVLVPFFDNLIWLSKKELDYQDWKLILNIKLQGKHFTDEGKEIMYLLFSGMNEKRLSTNLIKNSSVLAVNYDSTFHRKNKLSYAEIRVRALKLLSTPSNYEIHSNGKIRIKSLEVYLKGIGNITVKAFNNKGEILYSFNSIKECAQFFNLSVRTINRKLENGNEVEFNGNKLVLKRETYLP